MNEKFGHADFSYPANYSQTSYAAQHVIRAEVASAISASRASLNSYNSAPSVIFNPSQINENSVTTHAPSYTSAANILPPKQSQNFGNNHITSPNESKSVGGKLLHDILRDVSHEV